MTVLSRKHHIAKVEEPPNQYGFASKTDIDNLAQLIKQMSREKEKLKTDMAAVKKPKTKMRK